MFKQLLEGLLHSVDGAVGAFVVGLDGLLVESCGRSGDFNFEQLAADCSVLLKHSFAATASLPSRSLEELSLVTDNLRVVVRLLADSYFVVLLLSDTAHLGRARFELRKIHFELEKELAL